MAKEIKRLEVKEYCFQGVLSPINVLVKIDYDKEEVSLVERGENNTWKAKQWIFAGRDSDYSQGWTDILNAMQHAMTEAFKELDKSTIQRAKDNEAHIRAAAYGDKKAGK